VQLLDDYYFLSSFIFTVVFQLLGWGIAVAFKTETFYDFFGGVNFIVVAIATLCLQGDYAVRQVIVTGLLTISRGELAGFLAYRVLQREGDARFETAKDSPMVMLIFWSLQAVWVFVVALPAIFVNGSAQNPDLIWSDYLGFALAFIGILLEVLSDMQKFSFRSDPANKGHVCNVGLWYYSRHPNYFGEILIWWGLFIATGALLGAEPIGWVCVASPLLTMALLVLVSGIPMAEGKNLKRFYKTEESGKEYDAYFAQTSPLILCPPALYLGLPSVLKLFCCFEMPSFKYRPQKDSPSELISDPLAPAETTATSGSSSSPPGAADDAANGGSSYGSTGTGNGRAPTGDGSVPDPI